MIELLLQAERALGMGALDQAERLYWQAIDADSQNAIAIVGLAKVARQRGDDRTAIAFGRRALKVDAENAVARRLVAELEAAHPAAEAVHPAAEAVHAAEAGPPAETAPTAEASAATKGAQATERAPAPEPPAPAESAGPPAETASAGEADLGAMRGGRPDVEWPAADLQQIRLPRDR